MTTKSNESITRATHRYIIEHPSLLTCMRSGVINHSALARTICDSVGLKKFDAVVKASKRFEERLQSSSLTDDRIVRLLRRSRLEMKSKMLLVTIERTRSLEKIDEVQRQIRSEQGDFNLIQGQSVSTIITNGFYAGLIRKSLRQRIISFSQDLVQFSMLVDDGINETPGVVAYVYGLLAQNGINVLGEMSCWNDIMFVVDETDMGRVTDLLRFKS